MESSSSDELTSDSELDEIVEEAWSKTVSGHWTPQTLSSESESDEGSSQLFTFDTKPYPRDSPHTLTSTEYKCDTSGNNNDIDLTSYCERTNSTHKKVNSVHKSSKVHNRMELSSALQVEWNPSNIYVNLHPASVNRQENESKIEKLVKDHVKIMEKSVITPDIEKQEAVPTENYNRRLKQKENKKEREKTKGKGWNHMSLGDLSEDRKNDVMALKMRRALDPKRFYKGDDIKGLPKYFQFGTVVEDATEFYSARIPKKQRKKSIVEELMADAEFRKYNKRKYAEVQELKSKGLGPYKGIKTTKIKKKKKIK